MSRSKTTGKESAQTSALCGAKEPRAVDPESVARFQETMRLRSLAAATRAEYLRMVRKLVVRHSGDPAGLDKAAVRARLLWLKDDVRYSPSSMRMAVAAMRAYYGRHLGRDWRLFDLVRLHAPDIFRAAEVVAILRALQPAPLARPLARTTTQRRHAITLALTLTGIRDEELVAMAAFVLSDGVHAAHRPPSLLQRQPFRLSLNPVQRGRKSSDPKKNSSWRRIGRKPAQEEDDFQTTRSRRVSSRH